MPARARMKMPAAAVRNTGHCRLWTALELFSFGFVPVSGSEGLSVCPGADWLAAYWTAEECCFPDEKLALPSFKVPGGFAITAFDF